MKTEEDCERRIILALSGKRKSLRLLHEKVDWREIEKKIKENGEEKVAVVHWSTTFETDDG